MTIETFSAFIVPALARIGAQLAMAATLGLALGAVFPAAAQLAPPSRPAPQGGLPPVVGGLSAEDIAMAERVIEENTLTLRLPGLGTSVDGPGPLMDIDRLVLLALKFHHQRGALVPFPEFRARLEQLEPQPRYRRVAEEFWAWYREIAQAGRSAGLGGYKAEFGTYIAMKNTSRRKAANRALAAQVASEEAWRRASESERRFQDRISQGAADSRRAREEYLREWAVQASEAAAAEKAWQLYLSSGSGRGD